MPLPRRHNSLNCLNFMAFMAFFSCFQNSNLHLAIHWENLVSLSCANSLIDFSMRDGRVRLPRGLLLLCGCPQCQASTFYLLLQSVCVCGWVCVCECAKALCTIYVFQFISLISYKSVCCCVCSSFVRHNFGGCILDNYSINWLRIVAG